MADLLHFELVTPEKLLRSESVYMVVVPGTEGDFGVLVGHAPLMSTIRPGAIAIYAADGAVPERIFIDGGFAEVNDKGLTILAEGATRIEDIAPDAVASDLGDAREDFRIATSDVERAMAEKRIDRLTAMQDVLAAA